MPASELLVAEPAGRRRRGMLAWLEAELARKVLDEESGEQAEAGRLIARRCVEAGFGDGSAALRLTEATLRAQAEAAQDPDDGEAVEVLETFVTKRIGAPVLPPMDAPPAK